MTYTMEERTQPNGKRNICLFCDAVTGVPPAAGWKGGVLIDSWRTRSFMVCPEHASRASEAAALLANDFQMQLPR